NGALMSDLSRFGEIDLSKATWDALRLPQTLSLGEITLCLLGTSPFVTQRILMRFNCCDCFPRNPEKYEAQRKARMAFEAELEELIASVRVRLANWHGFRQ